MGGEGNLKSNFIKIYNFEFTRTALQCLRGCDRGGRVPQELPGHRPPLLLAAWRIGAHRFIEPSSEGRCWAHQGYYPFFRIMFEPLTLLLMKFRNVLGPQKFNQYDNEDDDLVRLETKLDLLLLMV